MNLRTLPVPAKMTVVAARHHFPAVLLTNAANYNQHYYSCWLCISLLF